MAFSVGRSLPGGEQDAIHMKNKSIEEAIQEFRNRTLLVYRADPDRIVRDVRAAERAAKDHVGRWLFELLQNSDDAGASEVLVLVGDDTVYVADNGDGFKPGSVSAICGTDFSDKTTGTIGRKGVGFKSVYEVSQNPQVLTVDGEGIEFSPERTKAWLRANDLNEGHVPYQWVPFLIPWDNAQTQDPHLDDLKANAFKTVVRLPGLPQESRQKVEQLLMEWPPHSLFAFRHLRQITARGLKIVLSAQDSAWSLRDSRGQISVEWRVTKHTEFPPADLLEMLGADERKAVATGGVSFLIAAPLENGCVVPTSEYLPIHVFYPTDQKGPVRLLLHAEFLVKSDRTVLMPVDGNPFNAWVADRLAYHVCKFVNNSYRSETPSSHAALLAPFTDRTSHPVAEGLWHRIANEAKKCLRLADVEGCQRLRLEEARLISVTVRPDLARTLIEATSIRGQLLHSSFDNDKDAHKSLRELGFKVIHDQCLMATIADNSNSLPAERQWVWACWEWLAAWVAKEPYGEEHKKRIEYARSLPIVPVDGSLVKASYLAGRIVTWKPDTGVGNLPGWLPLTFVEDWFRDRIKNEGEQESPVRELRKKLGIDEPGADVIQRAVGYAIDQYWKDRQGDPGRFLNFILEQEWHETSDASDLLQRCPIPLSRLVQGKGWSEAKKAYFGYEWGNDLLCELYNGIETVAWTRNDNSEDDNEKYRQILEWLGVADCPRILQDGSHDAVEAEKCRVRPLVNNNYVLRANVLCLDRVSTKGLSPEKSKLLLTLLSHNWERYYRNKSTICVEYTPRSRTYNQFVPSAWWNSLLSECIPPLKSNVSAALPLKHCWQPDKRTERAIGDLLPVIDLDPFETDKDTIREWFINAVGLRTRIEQLTVEEWKGLLSRHIPGKAPVERLVSEERLRDKVTGWYAACLETVVKQEDVSAKAFESCPLLCRKGGIWQYVANELRYLDDDNDLGMAFSEDVWLYHVPALLADKAVKYFGVLPLSRSVEVEVMSGEPQSALSGELDVRFRKSLPFAWAWRSSQSKQAADRLSVLMKGLEVLVVPALKARLSLNGLRHEVERRWHVNDHTIYLHKNHVNEADLALALAKALDVRSEADFYENLFRCTDDRQRKEKLLSKGISDTEIDRCLREYSGTPTEVDYGEDPEKATKGENGGTISKEQSGGGGQEQHRKQPTAERPGETSQARSSESPESGKQPLRLKDPCTTPYVLGSPPSEGTGTGGSGEGGGGEREGRSLTDAEKAELEETGRTLAVRELKSKGFSVEKMLQSNPGFDLRAMKEGDELRIEVKAHSGRATVVDVTRREYKEYREQHEHGYHWELWNVEHLAEDDSYSVVITRYDQIPDDALVARTFRVDLKKCQRKLQD